MVTTLGVTCIEVNGRNRVFHTSNYYIFVAFFSIDLSFWNIKENILLYLVICFSSRFSNCFMVRLQPQVGI